MTESAQVVETWASVIGGLGGRPPNDPGGRVLIVSAHPDDEVIGLGSWIAANAERDLLFVTATDGEASHPGSRTLTREELARRRPLELVEALRRLGVREPRVERLRLPDGGLGEHRLALLAGLEPLVGEADLVVAPFEADGHPDHDVVGEVCRELCSSEQCTSTVLWRYPIWTWEWVSPGGQAWLGDLHRLVAADDATRRKVHALEAFVTQVQSVDGAEPVVTTQLLEHATSVPEAVLA